MALSVGQLALQIKLKSVFKTCEEYGYKNKNVKSEEIHQMKAQLMAAAIYEFCISADVIYGGNFPVVGTSNAGPVVGIAFVGGIPGKLV